MTIRVRVTTNARSASITESGENSYAARVNAPATNGRANVRLIGILSEYFGIPKSRIRIVGGMHSREKLVDISGISPR
ncbi:MAG: DUF167 domain-containing protein [Candidatus Marsarchaeota archaeon]|nr:DUF167 domain-containing protein [Candidatus Marsarchaeota archaeon]MCL5413361.1 DUF167 domain-containing protein [Candidatus Marsarchaeota archaeon]